MATSNFASRSAGETGPRHLWLAGLGLVSILRREAVNANERALMETTRLQRRAFGLAKNITSQAADSARGHLDPMVAMVCDGLGVWVAPTLERLGLRASAPRAGRKPAAEANKRRGASVQSRRSIRMT